MSHHVGSDCPDVAAGTVGLGRVRAGAGAGQALTGEVTAVGGRADNGILVLTGPLTDFLAVAPISVVAARGAVATRLPDAAAFAPHPGATTEIGFAGIADLAAAFSGGAAGGAVPAIAVETRSALSAGAAELADGAATFTLRCARIADGPGRASIARAAGESFGSAIAATVVLANPPALADRALSATRLALSATFAHPTDTHAGRTLVTGELVAGAGTVRAPVRRALVHVLAFATGLACGSTRHDIVARQAPRAIQAALASRGFCRPIGQRISPVREVAAPRIGVSHVSARQVDRSIVGAGSAGIRAIRPSRAIGIRNVLVGLATPNRQQQYGKSFPGSSRFHGTSVFDLT